MPLFECLLTSPFSNFQPNQRVALQPTDVKRCIRSSTDRCRRRGSQPTAWFSLLPNSACEYLFIANRICWFILDYQPEETDIIQCFPTLGPKYMCRVILSFVFCFSIHLYLPQPYIKILVDVNNLSPAGVFPTGWLAGQITVVVFLSVIELLRQMHRLYRLGLQLATVVVLLLWSSAVSFRVTLIRACSRWRTGSCAAVLSSQRPQNKRVLPAAAADHDCGVLVHCRMRLIG